MSQSDIRVSSTIGDIQLEDRPLWSRHIEFVVTLIGSAVGLGNVWRFPHLCYTYGGGAFLIPYFISLMLLGIPIFFLEVAIGQFASIGTLAVWEINPLLKGFSYSMVLTAGFLSIFYSVVIATVAYFLFASMQSPLPWISCGNDWNTCYCRTFDMDVELNDSLIWYNDVGLNCTGMKFTAGTIKSSSEEYYHRKVLEETSGIEEPGELKWDLTLCNLLVWILVYLSIAKGIKSMGKVGYISALLPYVLLTALLIRGVTLDGASKGVDYYLSIDTDILTHGEVWSTAASQILFSLSCSTGCLMTMSSYNKFHANAIRDSFVISIINCGTSFYAGFAIFTVLGFMSETTGKDIGSVSTNGPGLAFVAFPTALSEMPVPQLWSVLFFLMMLLLGLGSEFPLVETVITAFQDEYPLLRTRKYSVIFRILVCVLGFLLGLPQTTQGGNYVLNLCNRIVDIPLMLIGFLEIVVVWIYGPGRFSEDMMLMLGYSKANRVIFYFYLKWVLLTVSPLFILAITITYFVEYKPITVNGYPDWAEALGWVTISFILMWTPLWYIVSYCQRSRGYLSWKLLVKLNQPTPYWGPADVENRTISRYHKYIEPLQNAGPDHEKIGLDEKGPLEGPLTLDFQIGPDHGSHNSHSHTTSV